jgi:hypothetical protein
MTEVLHIQPVIREESRQRSGFWVTLAMMICLPLVAIQGPAHTTPMDVVNAIFLTTYWVQVLCRRERISFPLLTAFWLILVGSCTGAFAAGEPLRALLCVVEDLYLFIWFVTLHDFLSRRSRIDDMAIIFASVACAVAFCTWTDSHFHLFGGTFAGEKRAVGTFQNPNMFGDYLVVSFFLTWAVAAAGRRLWYLGLPVLLFGILATASNGCLMSVIAGVGTTIIAYRGFWNVRLLGVTLVTMGLLLALVCVFQDSLQQAAFDRFSGGRSEVGGAALKGASERFPIWENVMLHACTVPGGVGPGNFSTVNADTTGDYHGAHSEYLGMLAERGVFGLAGWLAILGGLFMMLRRLRAAADVGFKPLGVEPMYGFFGAMAAHALVIELSHFRHTWMVFAMVAAAATQATRLTAAPAVATEPAVLAEAA